MKVAIVGSGNVATVLGKIINSKGHQIVQVIGRNETSGKALAQTLKSSYLNFKSKNYKDADIYILAITDTALYHLDQYVHLGDKLVVHTAGSVSKDVLKNISHNYGIIYPLQSLVRDRHQPTSLPLLVDGSSDEVKQTILKFAESISNIVAFSNDEERLKYHVAGVIVNNFTTHLYAMADNFCASEGLEFKTLLPLIDETVARIKNHSPQVVQTGPAIREDIYTLGKHLQVLSSHPDLKYLYLKLSESILKLHQK